MSLEGWQRRRVREFSERLKRVNVDGIDLEPLSITKDRGVILQSEKYHKRIATDPRRYVFAEDGDFAFDPMSLYYGAIGRVDGVGRGLVSPDYVVFRTDESIDPHFLHALFRYPEMHKLYESLSETGNTFGKRRRLYWSIFEEIDLMVPPRAEQTKIAGILASADKAVEATQAVIDQLQFAKAAMMAELLTRGLPGRHTQFKRTEIGELPDEWRVAPVRSVAQVAYGLTVNAQRRASTSTQAYLTVANVQREGLDLTTVKQIGVLPGDSERYGLRAGDILIVEGNANPERLGRAFLWRDELPGALHQNHLIRARPTIGGVDSRWLAMNVNGNAGRQQILDHAKTSSGLHTINSRVVAELLIAVPRIEEQQAIVQVYAALEGRLDSERSYLNGLIALKSALMSVLFTGEVRVKPNPEPA